MYFSWCLNSKVKINSYSDVFEVKLCSHEFCHCGEGCFPSSPAVARIFPWLRSFWTDTFVFVQKSEITWDYYIIHKISIKTIWNHLDSFTELNFSKSCSSLESKVTNLMLTAKGHAPCSYLKSYLCILIFSRCFLDRLSLSKIYFIQLDYLV